MYQWVPGYVASPKILLPLLGQVLTDDEWGIFEAVMDGFAADNGYPKNFTYWWFKEATERGRKVCIAALAAKGIKAI